MAQIGGKNSQFEDRYKESIKRLDIRVQKRTDNITRILTKAYNNPKAGAKYWNKVRKDLNVEYRALQQIYDNWAKVNIPRAYRASVKELMTRLNRSKEIASRAKKSFSDIVTTPKSFQITSSLYKDAVSDWIGALNTGQSNLNRLTRRTQQALVQESFIDKSVAKAIESGNLLNNTFIKSVNMSDTLASQLKTVANFIDGEFYVQAGSKRYSPKYYAEMVTRVKFHEAQAFAATQTALNYGTSLVQVSNHNTITPICQEFEGKIYSIGAKDPRFPVLQTVPPFHVNCLHLLYPIFDTALEMNNSLNDWAAFSNGTAKNPPNSKSWVPIEKRA